MAEVFVPTLHTFAMENIFTGSVGEFRFRAVPKVTKVGKEVDFENSSIYVEYWHGPFCYEKSQMEGSKEFPMSADGRQEMIDWLQANI